MIPDLSIWSTDKMINKTDINNNYLLSSQIAKILKMDDIGWSNITLYDFSSNESIRLTMVEFTIENTQQSSNKFDTLKFDWLRILHIHTYLKPYLTILIGRSTLESLYILLHYCFTSRYWLINFLGATNIFIG